MKRLTLLCLVFGAVAVCGCSDEKGRRQDNQIAALSNQVAALSNQVHVDNVKARVDIAMKLLDFLNTRVGFLEGDLHRTVFLDTTDKAFQRIDSDTGSFFISVVEALPYLDGFRVRLSIGNPSSATYHGCKLDLKWARAKPPEASYAAKENVAWQNSLHYKQVNFTDELKPATWNTVEVVLSPAKSDELAYLEVKMQTDQLSLRPPAGGAGY
ncbi:MAG: hypothetical protein ACLPT4_08785 [Verrucomicrobiia bacterium]